MIHRLLNNTGITCTVRAVTTYFFAQRQHYTLRPLPFHVTYIGIVSQDHSQAVGDLQQGLNQVLVIYSLVRTVRNIFWLRALRYNGYENLLGIRMTNQPSGLFVVFFRRTT